MIELFWQPQSLCFTDYVWGEILKFARLYGWEPAGTLPPEDADPEERERWDGNYVRFRRRMPCRSRRNPTARRRARALQVHSSNVRRSATSAACRRSTMIAENPARTSTRSG
jgi:hypothetical protein